MEKNEQVFRSRKRMLFDNFLGGISWALGVWIGTTVVVAILVYFLSKVNLVETVGRFVAEVMQYAVKSNSPFNF